MSDRLREMCKSLRLAYVADIYEKVSYENPGQYLEALFQQEFELRDTAKGERLIKKARFINDKELDSFQWGDQVKFPPQIDREGLESLKFISRKENVILTGSPGTGKTHIATGLGRKACRKGYKVRFYRVADLVDQLEKAWSEGKLQWFKKQVQKSGPHHLG